MKKLLTLALLLAVSAFAQSPARGQTAETRQAKRAAKDNRATVEKFADLLYRQKKVAEAFNTYVAKDYVQHSPMLADGTADVIAVLTPMFENPQAHFTVRRLIVDGDYAVLMIHVDTAGRRGAVVDIYRLEGGMIVEHWDVGANFPEHPKSAHPFF